MGYVRFYADSRIFYKHVKKYWGQYAGVAGACWWLAGLVALSACSTSGRAAGVAAQEFRFADGGRAIFYQLDKSLVPAVQPEPQNLVFVSAGSGCASIGNWLPDYFTGLEGEVGALRILILHKRHIAPHDNGQRCSDAFVRDDHVSQWLADQAEFVRAQLAAQPGVPQRVILLGISEGAELAPLLAAQIPQSTHLVLLAHSGLAPLDAYRSLAQQYPHMQQGWQQLQQALAAPPSDPDAARLHGRSWRYWAEAAALQHERNLLGTSLPLFVAMGAADPLMPAGAATALQQKFAQQGRQNLTVLTIAGADHGFVSPGRNHLPDVWHQLELWLLK